MRRAEQRRRRQGIAQQALQCRAGQSENSSNRKSQDRARQANLAHDHLLHVAAAAEQGIDHGNRRQPHRSDSEGNQRQQHNEDNQPGQHAGAPARRDVSRHHDVLNAHQSSSKRPPRCRFQSGNGGHAAKKAHSSSQDYGQPMMGLTRVSTNFYHNSRRFPVWGSKGNAVRGEIPNAAAAPATVCGESFVICHWESRSWEGDEG